MQEKIKQIIARYQEISEEMGKPEVVLDREKYSKLAKEYAELEPIIKKNHIYQRTLAQLEDTRHILANENDEELKELAREELEKLEQQVEALEREIHALLIPPDPNDEKKCGHGNPSWYGRRRSRHLCG